MNESIFELKKVTNGYRGGIELPNGELASLFIGKIAGEPGQAIVKLGKKALAKGFVERNKNRTTNRSPDGFVVLKHGDATLRLSAWRWAREGLIRVAYTRFAPEPETGL